MKLEGIEFYNESFGIAVGFNSRILRTTNGGENWNLQIYPTFNDFFDIDFITSDLIFICGDGGIYKSTNGGINWNPTTAKGDFFTSVYFTNTVTGYAAGMTGTILKTTDAGETWKKLHSNNSLVNKNRNFTRIIFRNASVGYAVGWNGLMIKTTNGGETWTHQISNV